MIEIKREIRFPCCSSCGKTDIDGSSSEIFRTIRVGHESGGHTCITLCEDCFAQLKCEGINKFDIKCKYS